MCEFVCALSTALRSLPALPATAASGTWAVPVFLSALTQLTYLDLSSSHLTGTLPASWSKLTTLSYLILSSGSISGTLPPQWTTMANGATPLYYMNLNSNLMTGGSDPRGEGF